FDLENDRWMMPATRSADVNTVGPDQLLPDQLLAVARKLAPDGRDWTITLPDARTPVAHILAAPSMGAPVSRYIDPATLEVLPDQGTFAGTRFFYPYHYRLNSGSLGLIICALAAVVMMALCISGIIIH